VTPSFEAPSETITDSPNIVLDAEDVQQLRASSSWLPERTDSDSNSVDSLGVATVNIFSLTKRMTST